MTNNIPNVSDMNSNVGMSNQMNNFNNNQNMQMQNDNWKL